MCIKSAILVTSLQLVQARMVKTYPKKQETRVNYPLFYEKSFIFNIPFKNLHVFEGN